MITMMVNQGVQFAAVELEYLHTLVLAFRRSEDAHVGSDAMGFEEHTDEALDTQRLVALNVIDSAGDLPVKGFFHNRRYLIDIQILPHLPARGKGEALLVPDGTQQVGYQSILILILILTVHRRQNEMQERHRAGGGREIPREESLGDAVGVGHSSHGQQQIILRE